MLISSGLFAVFKKRLDWSNELLLHLGMAGPNINKLFEKKLNKSFQKNNVEFLNIGSHSLHKVHNAFRKGLSCLTIDLNQFACDIFFSNDQVVVNIDVTNSGTKAKSCFTENLISDEKRVSCKKECGGFLLSITIFDGKCAL